MQYPTSTTRLLPTSYFLLPTYCLLLTTLLTTYYVLLTAYYLLLTAYHSLEKWGVQYPTSTIRRWWWRTAQRSSVPHATEVALIALLQTAEQEEWQPVTRCAQLRSSSCHHLQYDNYGTVFMKSMQMKSIIYMQIWIDMIRLNTCRWAQLVLVVITSEKS